MAAPTNAAHVKKNPCQPGAVHTWHKAGDEMMRAMLYEAAQILLVRSTKWSWLKAWATSCSRMAFWSDSLQPSGIIAVTLQLQERRKSAARCGLGGTACTVTYYN